MGRGKTGRDSIGGAHVKFAAHFPFPSALHVDPLVETEPDEVQRLLNCRLIFRRR